MHKTFLIIRREYLERVKKRSFLLTTFLVPLLFIGMYIGVIVLTKKSFEETEATLFVYDRSDSVSEQLKNNSGLTFIKNPEEKLEEKLEEISHTKSKNSLLIIPEDFYESKKVELISGSKVNVASKLEIEKKLSDIVLQNEYRKLGLDPSTMKDIDHKVRLNAKEIGMDGDTRDSYTEVVMGISVSLSILIYLCLMLYGTQVMRGVIEEKTNRIVEVIVSSVKPFQLMLGKILGVGLVGLTQFFLWGILSLILITASSFFLSGFIDIDPQLMDTSAGVGVSTELSALSEASGINFQSILESINFYQIIGSFLLFFLGGYLLYSAIFAAVASAVDSETEVSQFTMPVTMPLLITYILSFSVLINDPDGSIATWLSFIPFTSPIAMMVRVPFGVETWEIIVSLCVLFLTFIAMTWVAAKVYRTGILMYGKKASIKEMVKWIKYQ